MNRFREKLENIDLRHKNTPIKPILSIVRNFLEKPAAML